MANQLAMPKSSDFKGDLKPAYDALYQLFGVLTGGLDWEINLHMRGSLEVDQGISIDGTSDFSGDVTFDENILVKGDLQIGATGWTINDSSDNLVFTDDGGVERFRLVDSAGAYAADVSGNLHVNENLVVDGSVTLGNSGTDTVLVAGSLTVQQGVTVNQSADIDGNLVVNGNLTVDNNTTLGNGAGDTVTVAGPLTVNGNLVVNGGTCALGNTTNDVVDLQGVPIIRTSDPAGISLGTSSNGRLKWYDATLGPISIPYYNGH